MNDQEFKPTAAMKLYAFQRAKLGEMTTDSSISKLIGVSAETISRWKHVNGYQIWLDEKIAEYRAPIMDRLKQTAIDKIDDIRFFEVLARKYGFFSPKFLREPLDDD